VAVASVAAGAAVVVSAAAAFGETAASAGGSATPASAPGGATEAPASAFAFDDDGALGFGAAGCARTSVANRRPSPKSTARQARKDRDRCTGTPHSARARAAYRGHPSTIQLGSLDRSRGRSTSGSRPWTRAAGGYRTPSALRDGGRLGRPHLQPWAGSNGRRQSSDIRAF